MEIAFYVCIAILLYILVFKLMHSKPTFSGVPKSKNPVPPPASYPSIIKHWRELVHEYKELSAIDRASIEGRNLLKRINSVDHELKAFEKSHGSATGPNVGNYTSNLNG